MAHSLAPTLIGRRGALATLQAELDTVLAGNGRVVFVSGEAGIGKTRLTREFLDRARRQPGVDSIAGQCFEGDTAVPYAPFVTALTSLRRHLAAAFEDTLGMDALPLAPLITESQDVHGPQSFADPSVARRRLFAAIIHTLATAGRQVGRVVILEDMHWADAASRELLVEFARAIQNEPVLLVCTYRLEALERYHPLAQVIANLERERRCAEIALESLDRSETARLLELTLERSMPTEFISMLHERAGGNPFFLEELLRSLIEEHKLDTCLQAALPGSVLEQVEIPISIRASVLGHLSELDPTARTVAQIAAVLGRTFDFELLRALTRLPEESLASALARCIEHQLVMDDPAAPGERYHFRHALTRETIYGNLSGRERLTMHRAALEHFETLAEAGLEIAVEALAYHSLRAREPVRARRYARQAGDRAMRLFAYRDALAQYEAALSLTPQDLSVERADLHVTIAAALRPLRRHADYIAHWREARALYASVGDTRGEAAMCLELASAAWEVGENEETFTTAQVAIDLLTASDASPCELARAYAMVARLHMLSSHVKDVAAWGERALTAALACGDEGIAAGVTISLGFAKHLDGSVDEGITLLQRGLEMALRSRSWLDVGRAYVNMSDCYIDRGEYARIFALSDAHLRHAERTGWEVTLPAMTVHLARAHLELGHMDEATARSDELVASSETMIPTVLPLALALRGTLLVRQGKAAEAGDLLERAVALVEHDGIFEKVSAVFTALIQAKIALGEREYAASLAERGLVYWRPLGPILGSERLLLVAVEALLAVDRPGAAREPFDALATIAERAGTGFARAALAEARALFATHAYDPGADQLWANAADAWHVLAMPYQEDRAHRQAIGHITTDARFSDTSAISPQPEALLTCPLTRRECEVLLAIARGKSTAEVAAALVLSEHTIHRHVANILAKLDVPTRAAAVALATRQGWL